MSLNFIDGKCIMPSNSLIIYVFINYKYPKITMKFEIFLWIFISQLGFPQP